MHKIKMTGKKGSYNAVERTIKALFIYCGRDVDVKLAK